MALFYWLNDSLIDVRFSNKKIIPNLNFQSRQMGTFLLYSCVNFCKFCLDTNRNKVWKTTRYKDQVYDIRHIIEEKKVILCFWILNFLMQITIFKWKYFGSISIKKIIREFPNKGRNRTQKSPQSQPRTIFMLARDQQISKFFTDARKKKIGNSDRDFACFMDLSVWVMPVNANKLLK